jgi:hypothetical protein
MIKICRRKWARLVCITADGFDDADTVAQIKAAYPEEQGWKHATFGVVKMCASVAAAKELERELMDSYAGTVRRKDRQKHLG